jgi:hypothetical protein
MRLIDVARVVRSKNAGPLHVTVDLMFADADGYSLALASPSLAAPALAALYGVAEARLKVVPYPAAFAIKVVIDRPIVAGTPGDSDVYGAQQHLPLLGVEL